MDLPSSRSPPVELVGMYLGSAAKSVEEMAGQMLNALAAEQKQAQACKRYVREIDIDVGLADGAADVQGNRLELGLLA
jgi:hypothetical protein